MDKDLSQVLATMGKLAAFCLDNMDKPLTTAIQAEFSIFYNQYYEALKSAERQGITERDAIVRGIRCPVEVPIDKQDEFEEWFTQRLNAMRFSEPFGVNLN